MRSTRKWKSVTRRSIDRADVCQPRPRELIGIAGQKWSSYSWMLDGALAPSWYCGAATGGQWIASSYRDSRAPSGC